MRNIKVTGLFFGLFAFMIVTGCALSAAGYVAVATAAYAAGGVFGACCLTTRTAEVRQVCSQLKVAVDNSEHHCIEVLRKIILYVEARDRYWAGHSQHVGELTERIAREMKLPDDACLELRLAGQLHDVGLFAVPESVIKNYSSFGVDEFRSIKKHSEVSYEVLAPLDTLSETALLAIRYHHERMNGTGYPAGLEGEAIPLEARIIAVADSYDAMTHDRPHRKAMEPMRAMSELRRCCPAGYDPQCVDALARTLRLATMETSVALLEKVDA